jgi:hypothetical protein
METGLSSPALLFKKTRAAARPAGPPPLSGAASPPASKFFYFPAILLKRYELLAYLYGVDVSCKNGRQTKVLWVWRPPVVNF